MIYKTTWKNPKGKFLIKVDDFEGKNGVWLTVTEAVYNYTKKVFRDKDVIDIQYTEKDGEKLVDRATKVGATGNSTPVVEEDKKLEEPPKGAPSYSNNKPKFDSELSKRQTCMNATASIMQSLVGQVDPNNVSGLMETIYKKALDLINI